jgi:hypothetical protein
VVAALLLLRVALRVVPALQFSFVMAFGFAKS